MSMLLIAGIRRYIHSTVFWVCSLLSISVGLYCGTLYHFEAYLYLFPPLICAVLISLSIGRKFANGIFRNKIVAGHTRGRIFLSETVLSLTAAIWIHLLHTVGMILLNHTAPQFVDWRLLAWIWFCVGLTTIAFSAVFVCVSCTVSKQTIAVIINILLVVFLYSLGFESMNALQQPEYNESVHIDINEEGENASVIKKVPNPEYVGDPLRTVLEMVESISPYGQFLRCRELFSPMLGLHLITEDNRPYGTDRYNEFLKSGKYAPPTDEVEAIEDLPLCQIGLILVLLGSGYLIFRKKDLK